MKRENVNARNAPDPHGGYSQAVVLEAVKRLVLVSGQIPMDSDDKVPDGFEAQARLVWRNVDAQLKAAGMEKSDLVKVTTYLADRQYATQNREIRSEFLGAVAPALTVVISGIFDDRWLLEVEAVAAQ
ncbi:enamine deaminase RidA (YjgF/YER057c/UK114 family) [Mycoplana sp. BE70]|uniref:RidA family protein n=1 Tax=Mycoplana sp. BE70 TaxID=2817775 RepID=UPI00285DDC65|nr:RidA family protein [Mycoplana sp. BE70]MDR6758788.1 enamine deaminase RidA (YjgF/YER057c/UK114 family) [Mycoplana sp. BE70]